MIKIMSQCKNNVNEVSQWSHFILGVFTMYLKKETGKVRDGFGGMIRFKSGLCC